MKTRLLLSLLLLINPAWTQKTAAQTTSLSVWPPLLEAMVQPGKSVTQVYRVKNEADDTAITISLVPFSPSDELGHIRLEPGPTPGYFSLFEGQLPQTLNLKAGETKELVLKIAIPESAPEGDYPAALAAAADPIGLIGGSGSTARAVIASPILLTVSKTGTPNRIAKIEEFKVLARSSAVLDSFDPIAFILRVKNQSFTRLRAVGQIEIFNTFGRKTITLPLQNDQVLAGSTRRLRLAETGGTEPTDLIWNPVLPLGRYTASASITPEDTNNTVTQTITFWVLPYKAILTITLIYCIFKLLTKIAGGVKLKQ